MASVKQKVTYQQIVEWRGFLNSSMPANRFANRPARDKIMSIAIRILTLLLGNDWPKRMAEEKNAFFGDNVASPEAFTKHYLRTVEFAEMLFNLQGVNGFEIIIEQLLKPKPDIAGVLAELETARAITFMGVPFKFRRPNKKLGDNYDGELRLPNGETAATETKCKVETTALSVPTLNQALDRSAAQLPDNLPGIIFLRIPHAWLNGSTLGAEVEAQWSKLLDGTVLDFLNRNSHIIAVEIFSVVIVQKGDVTLWWSDGREMANPNHKFDKQKDWSLMTRPDGAVPDWWVKLVDFYEGSTK